MRNLLTGKIWRVTAALVLLAVAGCNSGGESETPAGTVDNSGVGVAGGDLAPNFKLDKVDGGTLELYSLRGKVVLVDFWDTWCPPCKKALPHLQELSVEYKDDLVVVGVAFGRYGQKAVSDYVQQNGLTFEMVMSDPNFKVAQDFGGVQSIPTTFLIDAEGHILKQWTGYNDKSVYEAGIKQALGS